MNRISEKAVWGTIDDSATNEYNTLDSNSASSTCRKCHNVIPSIADFCPYCGIKLYVRCPNCANRYSTEYSFCFICGTKRECSTMQNVSNGQHNVDSPQRSKKKIEWKCLVCGYFQVGVNAPLECPMCHVGADQFVCNESYYECLVCGWKHYDTVPPLECPLCHVGQEQFTLVNE